MHDFDADMDLTDSTPSNEALAGPQQIGRFRIDHILGRGGMGEVYKAFDTENNRTVAIKLLNTKGYEDADTLKRFEREARAALVLDHPNIARFFGTERDDQGRPIIVMEYIEGRGLDALLEDDPELPFSVRVDFMIQAARGLENAYRRSIIHRDVKPSNLLVDPSGVLKIIDFGLAKSMWDNSDLTGTGLVVGTPRYISPEQGMGRNVDHRSDIYSLGATFYEVVTGQTPFEGDTPLAIMMKHINAPLVPPYMLNPRVPADVSEIIMKMMAKEPAHRYQDYEPLIRDLESAKIHRLAKERRTPGATSGLQTVVLPENMHSYTDEYEAASSYLTEGLVNVDDTSEEPEPTSRIKLVFLSLAGLVLLVMAFVIFMRPSAEPRERNTLGSKIASLFNKTTGVAGEPKTRTKAVEQDAENIRTTKARMEAIVSKVLALGNKNEVPTISGLRSSGQLTKDQTVDAWGSDFYITDSGGTPRVVSPGRDKVEGTSDDFRMSLDGSQQTIPPALKIEDIQ